jgi:hypothetical protein
MSQTTPQFHDFPGGAMNTDFLPDAVQWSEGMLLSPQHFQQNDIHAQALMHQRFTGAVPYGWGLRHLRIDPVRLAVGHHRIAYRQQPGGRREEAFRG